MWAACAGVAQAEEKLTGDLSIEQLADLDVTSVSRRAQPANEAPASVFVITSDDIERAGPRTIAGALRLAPNLQVGRIDAANYAISSRGFNQPSGTANKMLVLMDGRIIYTPLFSGVFWDEQNPIMEDLERIEVISGPGGTLWGSNAVNGVINITSKDAHETTGILAAGGWAERSTTLGLRYGARMGDSGAFRVYGQGIRRDNGTPSEFTNWQGGFRSDWANARDSFTLQGDIYNGDQKDIDGQIANTEIRGGNILARWTRRFADESQLSVQTYYDHTMRQATNGIRATVDAAAIDAQYNFQLTDRHAIVIGANTRVTWDDFIAGPGTVALDPWEKTLKTYSVFAQDTVAITRDIDFILGVKAEHNTYTGMEYMPSARATWRPSGNQMVWAAVSRAVRTPARVDRDLVAGAVIENNTTFKSEDLVSYELGYKAQPTSRFWFSATAFYNDYRDLRTVEATTAAIFPLQIRNGMQGETYGLETWGSLVLTDWWRLTGGLTLLEKNLSLDDGSLDFGGVALAGNDPEAQGTLRSLMDIGDRLKFDATLRAVGKLPDPKVDSYSAVDLRLSYKLTDDLDVAISGFNLFDDHIEFINPSLPPRESRRSYFISLRWRS